MDDFSSAGWDLLWSTYIPNLKSLGAPAMNGSTTCRKLGGLGALKVMGNVIIRQSAYDFLCNFNRKTRLSGMVFQIQRAICRKSPTLTHPTCIWCPSCEWLRWNFTKIWHQKTRILSLSCGFVLHDPMFSRLSRTPTCDRQTDTGP